jgi:hypothetical protein
MTERIRVAVRLKPSSLGVNPAFEPDDALKGHVIQRSVGGQRRIGSKGTLCGTPKTWGPYDAVFSGRCSNEDIWSWAQQAVAATHETAESGAVYNCTTAAAEPATAACFPADPMDMNTTVLA